MMHGAINNINKIVEGGLMAKDYTQMWSGIGLNLKAHGGLLAVLGDTYKNIYLAQKTGPKVWTISIS